MSVSQNDDGLGCWRRAALASWEAASGRAPVGDADLANLRPAASSFASTVGADPDAVASAAVDLAGGSPGGEMAPVNAIVGAVLANETLKAVSRKGEPANNFFFYDVGSGVGKIERLHPAAIPTPAAAAPSGGTLSELAIEL